MADVVRAMTRKNSLRAILREFSVMQIEKLIKDMTEIYQDLKRQRQAEIADEENRQKKIIELKALMLQEGIHPDEIIEGASAPVKKTVRPKFRLIDSYSGKVQEWSGRGRTPIWMVTYELNGGHRNNLLI